MIVLYVEFLIIFVNIFLISYLFFKFYKFLGFKKTSFPKILKYFLVISIVPILVFLVLNWVFCFLDWDYPNLISFMVSFVFLWLWFFILLIKIKAKIGKSVIFLLIFSVSGILINCAEQFFLKPFSIPVGSMENTLQVGDYLISNQIYYGHSFFNRTHRFFQFHQPQRGDVMIFVFPPDHTKDYVKRCIGLPGDVVEEKNKVLYINGVKQDEPYAIHTSSEILGNGNYLGGNRDNFGPVTVEAGHYFMMGDNRDNSYDSRYWGQLDEKLIKGKASVIYWRGKDHQLLFQEIH